LSVLYFFWDRPPHLICVLVEPALLDCCDCEDYSYSTEYDIYCSQESCVCDELPDVPPVLPLMNLQVSGILCVRYCDGFSFPGDHQDTRLLFSLFLN